jgi:hypothetical protein
MAKSKHKRTPKTVLKLPDLEQSKSAVMNSLTSASSKRCYDHAIREFIDWYCSEPRLAFNRTVVTRYRIALEQHPYAPSTINLRLAAIRRLAYEASDCGLLSPDLAAGIRRVKGVRRLGVRVGNWLTTEEGKNDGAILGLQAAFSRCGQRSHRAGAGCALVRSWRRNWCPLADFPLPIRPLPRSPFLDRLRIADNSPWSMSAIAIYQHLSLSYVWVQKQLEQRH